MKLSDLNLPIRVKKKNKTRGRPSKQEILLSKILSHEFNNPKIQKEIKQQINNVIMYGNSMGNIYL